MNAADPSEVACEIRTRAYVQELRSFYRLLGAAALVAAIVFTSTS
ncbi:MAG TPA: hypothetical protein VMG60_12435 [Burkholderiaceae bacterium]|nr:hypothetical protein [Burkholderiaceae bacterium]